MIGNTAVVQQLLVELDGRTVKLEAAMRDAERKMQTSMRKMSSEAGGAGMAADGMSSKYARGAQAMAGAAEAAARAGKLTGESAKQLVTQGSMMATMFGPTGAIVGAVGISIVAIIELFTRARTEAKKAREEIAEEFGKIADIASASEAGAAAARYRVGTPGAQAAFDKRVKEGDTEVTRDVDAYKGLGLLKLQQRLAELRNELAKTQEEAAKLPQKVAETYEPAINSQIALVKKFEQAEASLIELNAFAVAKTIERGGVEGQLAVNLARRAQATKDAASAEELLNKQFNDLNQIAIDRFNARRELDQKAHQQVLLALGKEILQDLDRLEKLNKELDEIIKKVGQGDLSVLDTSAIQDAIKHPQGYNPPPIVGPGSKEQAGDAEVLESQQRFEDALVYGVIDAFAAGIDSTEQAAEALKATLANAMVKALGGPWGAFLEAGQNFADKLAGGLNKLAGLESSDDVINGIYNGIQRLAALRLQLMSTEEQRQQQLANAHSDSERAILNETFALEDSILAREREMETIQKKNARLAEEATEIEELERELARVRANGNEETLETIEREERLANAKSDEARAILEQIFATEDAIAAENRLAAARREEAQKKADDLDMREDFYDIEDPVEKIKSRVGILIATFPDMFDHLLDGLDLSTQEGLDEFTERLQKWFEMLSGMTPEQLAAIGISPEMFDWLKHALLGLEHAADEAAEGIEDAVNEIMIALAPQKGRFHRGLTDPTTGGGSGTGEQGERPERMTPERLAEIRKAGQPTDVASQAWSGVTTTQGDRMTEYMRQVAANTARLVQQALAPYSGPPISIPVPPSWTYGSQGTPGSAPSMGSGGVTISISIPAIHVHLMGAGDPTSVAAAFTNVVPEALVRKIDERLRAFLVANRLLSGNISP